MMYATTYSILETRNCLTLMDPLLEPHLDLAHDDLIQDHSHLLGQAEVEVTHRLELHFQRRW